MEEILGAILAAIAEILFEVLLEIIGAVLDDLISRGTAEALEFPDISNPAIAAFGYLVLGALTGGVSLLLFPHPLFPPSRFHGIGMIFSPVLTGALMAMVGSYLRRQGKMATRIESFGYGYAFAFGMAAVRYWFAH